MVFPATKNIYRSLVRWDLHPKIKVSAAFSTDCLNSPDPFHLKPLLSFLQNSYNSYTITPPPHFAADEAHVLVSTHEVFIKILGFSTIHHVSIIVPSKPMTRKLSASVSELVEPYLARPNPFTTPAFIHRQAKPSCSNRPHSRSAGSIRQSATDWRRSPANPSMDDFAYPPCVNMGPAPEAGKEQGLWCVAKPSVPAADSQEALDFACGEGGADRAEIDPHGSCYAPQQCCNSCLLCFQWLLAEQEGKWRDLQLWRDCHDYQFRSQSAYGAFSVSSYISSRIITGIPNFACFLHCHFTLL